MRDGEVRELERAAAGGSELDRAKLRLARLRSGEEVELEVGDLIEVNEFSFVADRDLMSSTQPWTGVIVSLTADGSSHALAPWWYEEANTFVCRVNVKDGFTSQITRTDDLPVFKFDRPRLLVPRGLF